MQEENNQSDYSQEIDNILKNKTKAYWQTVQAIARGDGTRDTVAINDARLMLEKRRIQKKTGELKKYLSKKKLDKSEIKLVTASIGEILLIPKKLTQKQWGPCLQIIIRNLGSQIETDWWLPMLSHWHIHCAQFDLTNASFERGFFLRDVNGGIFIERVSWIKQGGTEESVSYDNQDDSDEMINEVNKGNKERDIKTFEEDELLAMTRKKQRQNLNQIPENFFGSVSEWKSVEDDFDKLRGLEKDLDKFNKFGEEVLDRLDMFGLFDAHKFIENYILKKRNENKGQEIVQVGLDASIQRSVQYIDKVIAFKKELMKLGQIYQERLVKTDQKVKNITAEIAVLEEELKKLKVNTGQGNASPTIEGIKEIQNRENALQWAEKKLSKARKRKDDLNDKCEKQASVSSLSIFYGSKWQKDVPFSFISTCRSLIDVPYPRLTDDILKDLAISLADLQDQINEHFELFIPRMVAIRKRIGLSLEDLNYNMEYMYIFVLIQKREEEEDQTNKDMSQLMDQVSNLDSNFADSSDKDSAAVDDDESLEQDRDKKQSLEKLGERLDQFKDTKRYFELAPFRYNIDYVYSTLYFAIQSHNVGRGLRLPFGKTRPGLLYLHKLAFFVDPHDRLGLRQSYIESINQSMGAKNLINAHSRVRMSKKIERIAENAGVALPTMVKESLLIIARQIKPGSLDIERGTGAEINLLIMAFQRLANASLFKKTLSSIELQLQEIQRRKSIIYADLSFYSLNKSLSNQKKALIAQRGATQLSKTLLFGTTDIQRHLQAYFGMEGWTPVVSLRDNLLLYEKDAVEFFDCIENPEAYDVQFDDYIAFVLYSYMKDGDSSPFSFIGALLNNNVDANEWRKFIQVDKLLTIRKEYSTVKEALDSGRKCPMITKFDKIFSDQISYQLVGFESGVAQFRKTHTEDFRKSLQEDRQDELQKIYNQKMKEFTDKAVFGRLGEAKKNIGAVNAHIGIAEKKMVEDIIAESGKKNKRLKVDDAENDCNYTFNSQPLCLTKLWIFRALLNSPSNRIRLLAKALPQSKIWLICLWKRGRKEE